MTQKELQAAVRRERRRSRGQRAIRYSHDLRAAVSDFVARERARGTSQATLAETLDLPINTLRRWCTSSPARSELVPVEIVGTPSESLVLVTPSGHRVEGLNESTLVTLLERLG